jgi:hypothetical protein
MNPYDRYLKNDPSEIGDRVALIMEAVSHSVERRPNETINEANVRHMEDFFSFLHDRFAAGRFQTEVQPIPKARVRTTDRNFIVTVPGRSDEKIVLVGHYDTWAGFSRDAPGADDNTTGEEVLKHYLLRDLCAEEPPPLTHVYLFAGSEECGSRGLISQFGLTVGLSLASFAVAAADPTYLLLCLPFLPLANYRFGVTGTRHFVDNLTKEDKASIQAAIAVDSVGEGRLYILENEMGANFLRALFPYEGSESLNDVLEEGAHLNHIKYNRYLAGGTTDSVAFLEERRFLPGGKQETPIPAAALITMAPGKASPMVFGGKLHTRHDTPDRIHEEPLMEVLTVLDYALDILQGGERPNQPRRLSEHHYARLYRDGDELFLALKDAVEPNRRNINSIFRVEGDVEDSEARLRAKEVVWWGVETTLDKEMRDFRPKARRMAVDAIVIEGGESKIRFESSRGAGRRLMALAAGIWGGLERLLGRYAFLAMLLTAFIVALIPTRFLEWAVFRFSAVADLVVNYYVWVAAGMLVFQIAVLFRLFTRELPAWMDNAYRHRNRADNLRSLKRFPSSPSF